LDSISYTAARANLAKLMDRVCENHEPVTIRRSGQAPVVMLSLADFNSLEETAYLLRSPKNAKRLLKSIAGLEERTAEVSMASIRHEGERIILEPVAPEG
jgi:antitoxin YefM